MKNLMIIASLIGVKLNYNYLITDYSLLTPTIGNRGGISNPRVKQFVNLIKAKKFYFDLSSICVTPSGRIVEGHHRFEALKLMKLPVSIRIVDEKNLTDISTFNSCMNTKWQSEETFGASITAGSVVAKMLNELRLNLCERFKIKKNQLSACEMYGILVKSTRHFSSGKNAPTVEMWTAPALEVLAGKREFKKNIVLYARMKNELKSIRDAYKISKVVMDLYFNDEVNFDLESFCTILSYDGFILPEYNVKTITAKAMSMYLKQMKLVA
jgi:hypothetical protein